MTEARKFQAVKGMRDILPPDSAFWNRVERIAHEVFARYGFGEIRLPIFETIELFARSVGEGTDIVNKEMYVLDLHGSLALEYARDAIPKYSDDVTEAEFERIVGKFVDLINQMIATDRLERTPDNLRAVEMLRALYSQLRKGNYDLHLTEAIWNAAQDLNFPFLVALRPEATASVCRAYVEHNMRELPQPVRLYYLGPMFRRERPQKGRYRQFYQIGAELLEHVRLVERVSGTTDKLAAQDAAADAEVIEMVLVFIERCGLVGHTLYINSIGCKDCRPGYVALLRQELEKVRDDLGEESRRRIETNPLRVLDSKLESEQAVIESLPRIADHLCEACREHFKMLQAMLFMRQIAYEVNWRLVRGLDYYMRTTFEITAPGLGSQNAVCGGGRYDGLVELLGGPPTKGIGFALGTDRLILALQEAGKGASPRPLDAYIAWMGANAYPMAVRIAHALRAAGCSVELPHEEMKFKKSLGLAARLNARFAVILGDNEVAAGSATVKRMSDSTQSTVAEKELGAFLRA